MTPKKTKKNSTQRAEGRSTEFTEKRRRAGPFEAQDKLKAAATSLGVGLGVGVVGGPVFGREGDVPEVRVGEEELDANFDLFVGKFVNVSDDAFERIFGLRIR